MISKLGAYGRFIFGFPGYLKNPVTLEQARQGLQNRLEKKNENFLSMARQSIYSNPRSPYFKLLKEAGYGYRDLEEEIRKEGLESLLLRLMEGGVWISPEEFKGMIPLQRGSTRIDVNPSDFENQHMKSGIVVSTGGTSGRPVRTRLDLDFLEARAFYDHVMMEMLGLDRVPMAIWYPTLPASTGVSNLLRYAKAGFVPRRWFSMTGKGSLSSLENRLITGLIVRVGRLLGTPLPLPESFADDSVDQISAQLAAWLEEYGRCAFQTYVSRAVRVVQVLQKRRCDLSGLVLVVGSEPLTKSRRAEIEAAGATIYPRYAATEMGTIAMGCGNPEETDEHHLMSDMVSLVQEKDTPAGREGSLYLTSLNQVMPKIMLNVQLGDMAAVSKRNCGCPFEKLGFTTHIFRIRSYSRFTGDGMAVSRFRMEQIIEGLLTEKYGGSSIDYQLVEMENREGQTELKLRISPEVGEIDEESLARDVLIELRKSGEGEQLMAAIWQETGVFSVVREFPQPTARGKLGPLLQEHQS